MHTFVHLIITLENPLNTISKIIFRVLFADLVISHYTVVVVFMLDYGTALQLNWC